MKLQTLFPAALLASGLFLGTQQAEAAPLQNGNFGGGLSSWSYYGDVAASAGSATLTTASLYADDPPAAAGAFNLSGTSAVEVGTGSGLEVVAGLSIGSLDPDPANAVFAMEGSILSQSFDLQAGQSLSFDWSFGSNEDPVSGMNDYAFVIINGTLSQLADVVNGPASGHFSQSFATDQTISLIFGVVDVNDFLGTSSLSISQVSVTSQSVPEPASLALALGGLALCGLRRRR